MSQLYLHYNGTSLSDQTTQLNNYFQGDATLSVGGGKYLYLASQTPLITRYVGLAAEAATAATLSVEYYAGKTQGWVSAAYLRDETDGLSASGSFVIQPNKDTPWVVIDDTSDVTELSSFTIYGMYWCRLSLSVETSVDFNWLGYKFCSTTDINAQYPSLNKTRVYEAFGAGKTNWEDESVLASELVSQDLKRYYTLDSLSQIASLDVYKHACIHRAAMLIWSGLGDVGVDNAERAFNAYQDSLKFAMTSGDADKDGVVSKTEAEPRQTEWVR